LRLCDRRGKAALDNDIDGGEVAEWLKAAVCRPQLKSGHLLERTIEERGDYPVLDRRPY
jgi:hypothetical protein